MNLKNISKENGYEMEELEKVNKIPIESLTSMQEDLEGDVLPCPRCGLYQMDKPVIKNALSRRAYVYICNKCGTDEAMIDMAGEDPLPLNKWAMIQGFNSNSNH